MQAYSDPKRANDPHALPNVEVFKGYRHECRECEREYPLFTDYYGLLYVDKAECPECGSLNPRSLDTRAAWYWWSCFPGCLPDSDPFGPFATEAEALADAQENAGDDDAQATR